MVPHAYDNLEQPLLIIIRGLPGSGKSYLADALQKAFGADNTVLLDPDAIDFESKAYKDHVAAQPAGDDPKVFPFRFSQNRAYAGIEAHKIIIWNQAFTNLEMFQRMIGRLEAHAETNGTRLPVLIVEVAIDPAVAKERVAKREVGGGHGVDNENFERFLRDYTSFADQGFNVISVDGQDDITTSVTAVAGKTSQLLGLEA
ncbi:MAG TPA: AAA family ATPase [Candidatus Saccharimonadales bacterium]|nr:AAA family ATPase [Candidatus Saccharimonadales bacterium]